MKTSTYFRVRCICNVCCILLSSFAFEGTECVAQVRNGQGIATISAVPLKILAPAYPRLAQQARIAGDVNLILTIGKLGQVESVDVLDGHPMLREVAIESARRSLFACPDCKDHSASYSLRYRFQISPLSPERACSMTSEPDPPVELNLAEHEVTVSA